jgi:hypothetical protein
MRWSLLGGPDGASIPETRKGQHVEHAIRFCGVQVHLPLADTETDVSRYDEESNEVGCALPTLLPWSCCLSSSMLLRHPGCHT